MSALTVAGQQLFVLDGSAYLEAPETQGKWRRLPAGGVAVSTERDGKRGLACVVRFDPPATYLTVIAALSELGDLGAAKAVTVVGDLTHGQTWSAFCWLGRGQWLSVYPGTLRTEKRLHCPLTVKEA